MAGDNLDARLEPVAQAFILLLVLVAVASVAFFIINKVALRRKERAHNKLSTSRRSKHTWVDISVGRERPDAGGASYRAEHRRRRRSSSSHQMLDLGKPKETKPEASAPDENPIT